MMLSTTSRQKQIPSSQSVPVNFRFGDPASSSGSEKYRLILTPLEGDTTGHTERFRTNTQYGVPSNVTFRLPKGAKYKVELKHIDTNRRLNGNKNPDYDYEIELTSTAGCVALQDAQSPQTPFLGSHYQQGATTTFLAAGKSGTLYVPLFEWVTPKGSPVTAPDDTVPGQNEFTYNGASPGILAVKLKVLVKPTGTAGMTDYKGVKFSDRCVFDLPSIAGSTFQWGVLNPGGVSFTAGETLFANGDYTTLPILNSEFGLKVADFKCDGMVPPEIDHLSNPFIDPPDFEVFFEKDSDNHVGGQVNSPNWYHYWSQALGVSADHSYDGTIQKSQTIVNSATQWQILIGPNASWPNGNLPTGVKFINGFWATNLHENWHRDHRVHNFIHHGGHSPPGHQDIDGDGVCDREIGDPANSHTGGWEAIIGTLPIIPDSTEVGAERAETLGNYIYGHLDWSNPGTNNKNN